MESLESKIKIYLGDFPVVDIKVGGGITINVGRNVHITIYLRGDIYHNIKEGDILPLFTEISYANLRPTPVQ
jgi:hypothetical protein